MADYGLSKTGLRVPSQAELLEDYQNLMRSEFGHDVDTGADSVWGHLSNIESQRMSSLYEIVAELYASLTPSGAEGVGLDKISDFANVKRLAATYSTIEAVSCVGTPGTTIPLGSLCSVGVAGDQFASDAAALIPAAGVVSVDFTAVVAGATRANAGTLNTIATIVAGWTSVSNTSDAQVGSPIESDTDFRTRRARSLRLIGESTFNALAAQMVDTVTGVSGISDILLVHNITDTDNSGSPDYGLPPHSFEFTIEGGASSSIAEKILELAPAGIRPYSGATGADKISATVVDDYGNSHTIEFTRRAETEIWIHAVVEVNDDFATGNVQSDTVSVDSAVTGDYSLTIDGVTFSYHAVTTGSITAVADAGGGVINITSVGHGLDTSDQVDISGTVSYNGVAYTVTVLTDDVFQVTKAFVASETGSWEQTGGADTAITIAAGLTAAVNAPGDWVPVLAVHTATESTFSLQGEYEGCAFVLVLVHASLTRSTEDHVAAVGDQAQIIENIVNYAEGDGTDEGIQKIGTEVYLWKYTGPVGEVDNVVSVTLYILDSQPTGAPTIGWGTGTIDIDNRHKALFDSTRITVEASVV